jgi:hypothetical protein
MDPYADLIDSPRRAARAAREQRIALSNPIRVERIRAVRRIDRRKRVGAFFGRRIVGAFAFIVIVLCAIAAGLIAVKFLGAS